jgi:hypothetical protein
MQCWVDGSISYQCSVLRYHEVRDLLTPLVTLVTYIREVLDSNLGFLPDYDD